jgi:hypothetical protein
MNRDSIVSAAAPVTVQDDLRANSMASFVSSETNPFVTSPSPVISNFDSAFAVPQQTQLSLRQPQFQADPSVGTLLQSIPETQQHHQRQQSLSIAIREKPYLSQPNLLSVLGQIWISHHGDGSSIQVPIQLQHLDGIEQITPSPQFVTVQDDGQYLLNMNQFSNSQEGVVCFTYTLKTSILAIPVRIAPTWKCVDNISYLMIKHNKNIVADTSKLRGVLQVVMTDQDVNSVQSTPQGIWDVTKQRLTWNMNDLLAQHEQNDSNQQRLLAKFYVEGKGTPQPVYLSYQIKDSLISGISISCDSLEIKHLETMVQSDHLMYM